MINDPPTKRQEEDDPFKQIYRIFRDQTGNILKIVVKEGEQFIEFRREG